MRRKHLRGIKAILNDRVNFFLLFVVVVIRLLFVAPCSLGFRLVGGCIVGWTFALEFEPRGLTLRCIVHVSEEQLEDTLGGLRSFDN